MYYKTYMKPVLQTGIRTWIISQRKSKRFWEVL